MAQTDNHSDISFTNTSPACGTIVPNNFLHWLRMLFCYMHTIMNTINTYKYK